MQLTYDEIVDILDVRCFAGSTKGYTLPPGIYEISDFTLMLKSLLPDEVKVKITIDDIRLRSNLTTKKLIRFTKYRFFVILSFVKSHSGPLSYIPGFGFWFQEVINVINLIILQELIKFNWNVIALTVVLSMISENQYKTLLLSVHLHVLKCLNNLESNFLKR